MLAHKINPYWLSWHRKSSIGYPCTINASLLAILSHENQPRWQSCAQNSSWLPRHVHRKIHLVGLPGERKTTSLAILHMKFILVCYPDSDKGKLPSLTILTQENQPRWLSWHRKINLIGYPGTGKSTSMAILQ